MSRLPTLTTPRSLNGSPGNGASGIPAPSSMRRPRSSLGPGNLPTSATKNDPERDAAYSDLVMRRRPPSALGRSVGQREDPDTPTQNRGGAAQSFLQTPNTSSALATPRTPGLRPRTPSSLVTPSSRPTSRPVSARSSLVSSANTPARRTSVASSTSAPYRRPESRTGFEQKWTPTVGERVRLPSHGYEGTLRYLGPTHIRDGIWAGVELDGGFKGKGRNDGSVDGVKYFECEPNCGIFALAEKLAPPTSVPTPASRPASVASYRSMTSSASGRATPSSDLRRKGATTPSFGTRSVTSRTPRKAVESSAATAVKSAAAASNITEGSRASKYLNMTARQLDARSTGTPTSTASTSNLSSSTNASVTPKATKIGTPGRMPRPSLGGSLATPKARAPRASEMMPPPPSPQAAKQVPATSPNTAALEKEIEELRRRNAELEEQVGALPDTLAAEAEKEKLNEEKLHQLQTEVENAKAEADALRIQLSASSGDADGVKQQVEELQTASSKLREELAAKEREVAELQKDMRLATERAASELEAGMDARREEMREVQERADAAETEAAELKKLVDELTTAGNQIIELSESKQFQFETQIRELEEKLAKATEEAAAARELAEAAPAANAKPRAPTAAEIDNETLTDQVKHLQSRIHHLEEQLDEARGQAETDSDAWQAKYNKSRDAEKTIVADLQRSKDEVAKLNEEAAASKERIAELQGALNENQAALESARAEIETLRQDATESASSRTVGGESDAEIAELKEKLEALSGAEERVTELEAKVAELEGDLTLARKVSSVDGERALTGTGPRRSSSSIEEAEKSILGYRHIVTEMKEENSQLKSKQADLMDEIAMLKEEIRLLQDINDTDAQGSGTGEELVKLRGTVSQQGQTIKEYEREVSELESLVESKIYREDELETRVQELESEVARLRVNISANGNGHAAVNPSKASHTRNDSVQSVESTGSTTISGGSVGATLRCELCEGPHELDACPVFTGEAAEGGNTTPLNIKKSKKWCNDCESSAHSTAECPLADDVF